MLSAVLFGTPSEDSSSIINVGVDDEEHMRIVGASHFELLKVAFKLDIALEEEELGVIFVKDTVRNAGAIDATADLNMKNLKKTASGGMSALLMNVRASCVMNIFVSSVLIAEATACL